MTFFRHENSTDADFRSGSFTSTGNNHVRVATFASDPMFCERSRAHSARDGIDGYFLVFPTEGEIVLAQRGREVAIRSGQFSLIGTEGAHTFTQPGRAGFNGILIPGEVMRARSRDIDDSTVNSFKSAGMLVSLFVDYVDSFCYNASVVNDQVLKAAADHIVDFTRLVVDKVDAASSEPAIYRIHYRRALAFIDAHIQDSGLDGSRIAQGLGVSERHLRRIFAAHGASVAATLKQRRSR